MHCQNNGCNIPLSKIPLGYVYIYTSCWWNEALGKLASLLNIMRNSLQDTINENAVDLVTIPRPEGSERICMSG